jgi:hypothetical protein
MAFTCQTGGFKRVSLQCLKSTVQMIPTKYLIGMLHMADPAPLFHTSSWTIITAFE